LLESGGGRDMEFRGTGFQPRSGCIDKAAIRRLAGKYDLDCWSCWGVMEPSILLPAEAILILPFFQEKGCNLMSICS